MERGKNLAHHTPGWAGNKGRDIKKQTLLWETNEMKHNEWSRLMKDMVVLVILRTWWSGMQQTFPVEDLCVWTTWNDKSATGWDALCPGTLAYAAWGVLFSTAPVCLSFSNIVQNLSLDSHPRDSFWKFWWNFTLSLLRYLEQRQTDGQNQWHGVNV